LENGTCKGIFTGHTNTIRDLAIAKPELLPFRQEDGSTREERWPKEPLIVTGSRDHTLRVWKVPNQEDMEHHDHPSASSSEIEKSVWDAVEKNPYHHLLLSGHDDTVRCVAARGRIAVSGSYDRTVRVWDIITGEVKYILKGHEQKVWCIVYDPLKFIAASGSMDASIRIWSTLTGSCLHTIKIHTSLVGLLRLEHNLLVSGSADSRICIFDSSTGSLLKEIQTKRFSAVTALWSDGFKVVYPQEGNVRVCTHLELLGHSGSGVSEGELADIAISPTVQSATLDLSPPKTFVGIWDIACSGRYCVAAAISQTPDGQGKTTLEVWDVSREGDPVDQWFGEVGRDGSL